MRRCFVIRCNDRPVEKESLPLTTKNIALITQRDYRCTISIDGIDLYACKKHVTHLYRVVKDINGRWYNNFTT